MDRRLSQVSCGNGSSVACAAWCAGEGWADGLQKFGMVHEGEWLGSLYLDLFSRSAHHSHLCTVPCCCGSQHEPWHHSTVPAMMLSSRIVHAYSMHSGLPVCSSASGDGADDLAFSSVVALLKLHLALHFLDLYHVLSAHVVRVLADSPCLYA